MPHQDYIDEEGHNWPSVTQIGDILAKPGLLYWYGKFGTEQCEQIKRQSAEIGTRVHSVFEDTLSNVPVREEDPHIVKLGLATIKELRNKPLEVWEIEQHLQSDKHKFHGTPDLVALYDGVPTIIDLKTANRIYREVALQLTGYAIAWNETHKKKVNYGYVIQINKETEKIKIQQFENLKQYEPVFLGLRRVWDFVEKRGAYESKKVS